MTLFNARIAALLAVILTAETAVAQNTIGEPGLLVSVPTSLDSTAVTRIKARVEAALNRPDDRPSRVVFEFNPGDKDYVMIR